MNEGTTVLLPPKPQPVCTSALLPHSPLLGQQPSLCAYPSALIRNSPLLSLIPGSARLKLCSLGLPANLSSLHQYSVFFSPSGSFSLKHWVASLLYLDWTLSLSHCSSPWGWGEPLSPFGTLSPSPSIFLPLSACPSHPASLVVYSNNDDDDNNNHNDNSSPTVITSCQELG